MRPTVRRIGAAVDRLRRAARGPGLWLPGGLIILAHHRVDDGPSDLAVSPAAFRAQLDWLEAAGLQVVDIATGPYPPVGDPPTVAFAFDDGYRSVAEVAWPELRARGWPATVYAVSRTLTDPRPFEWDAGAESGQADLIDRILLLELAADGMSIGSHTSTHRYLPGLPPTEARQEVRDSRREIEDLIGREVRSFSYPMGGWNRFIRSLVAQAGYVTAVTSDRGRNHTGQDRLALRRHPVDRHLPTFVRTLNGSFDFLRPFDRVRDRWRQAAATAALSRRSWQTP